MTYLRICINDLGMQWNDDFFCNKIMMNEKGFYFVYLISFLVLLAASIITYNDVCCLLCMWCCVCDVVYMMLCMWCLMCTFIVVYVMLSALINYNILKTNQDSLNISILKFDQNWFNELEHAQQYHPHWFSMIHIDSMNLNTLFAFCLLFNAIMSCNV